MYYLAYSAYILAFLLIFIFNWYLGIYLFATIFWLWFWMFWCAVRTQELVNIEDKTRDIYSSMIYSWKTLISIITPLLIAVLFFVVEGLFDFNPYMILFLFLPIIYGISFIFIKDIWDYTPNKINKLGVLHYFNFKKNFFSNFYFLVDGLLSWIYWSLYPIIAIVLLKTEVNVWLLEGIVWVISFFVIIFMSSKRKIENRLKILWIISFLLFLNTLIFSFNFNIIWYLIFISLWVILNPLYKSSEHVIKLKLIDNLKIKWSDFFTPMIFREVNLWIGRVLIIVFFIFLVNYWVSLENTLKIWLFLTGIFFILTWVSIFLHMKYENEEKN
jgi:hypothetical protein